jgi:hypothetical protein
MRAVVWLPCLKFRIAAYIEPWAVAKKPVIPKVYVPKKKRNPFAVGFWIVVAIIVASLFIASCRLRFPLETGI